ncbi:hypothetical protein EUTSA_v10012000mg, partial [Eutrema salsugineum]
MTRKKVKLAYIANDSSRKATFKKRKKGLLKKVNELSTLCGITACAIIYSPYDSNPEFLIFRHYRRWTNKKKMVDQDSFLKQRIVKASEHLKKQKKDNRETEMTKIMFQSLDGNTGMFHLNIMDLNDLDYLIEQYLKDINRRIEILKNAGMEMGNVAAIATITTAPTAVIHEVGSSSSFAAAAAFFNPFQHHHQQQCRHPPVRHVGFFEQTRNLNLNQNHNKNQQQFFMEIMNHPEQISYA